jgi:transcriptional regulator with XRE-family HTH domain
MNQDFLKEIGQRMQSVRKAKGVSQEALGNKFKVARHTILNYENGHRFPNVDYLFFFINEFNVNANWLLVGRGEMFIGNKGESKTRLEIIQDAFPEISIDDTFMTVIDALADPDLSEVLRHEFYIAMKAAFSRFPQLLQKSKKVRDDIRDKQTVLVEGR